jgi:hypothetical protein
MYGYFRISPRFQDWSRLENSYYRVDLDLASGAVRGIFGLRVYRRCAERNLVWLSSLRHPVTVERDGHAGRSAISVVRPIRADYFAFADDLASHPFPIFDRGEFEPEVEGCCRLDGTVGPKQDSGTAHIFGISLKPFRAAGQAVTKGDVNGETPRATVVVFLPFS